MFRKPSAAAYTIPSLLGSFLLGRGAIGRRLRIHIEPTTIEASLRRAFGESGSALAGRLRGASAKIERELRDGTEGLNGLVGRAKQQAGDDTESLVTIRSAKKMREQQRTCVRIMAWNTMKALAALRDHPKIASVLMDADKTKLLLVRMLAERGPVLTEDAWDLVLAEDDVGVLAWWIALASLQADELHLSQVRRALFENAQIRRYAITIGRDDSEMGAIGRLIAKHRTRAA